ncbi:MAG TPA: hypothetical protein DCX95_05260 [Elusimicrobia bacterium]|nr:hypothetical protein [Elusimicrobiota bacterium]
MLYSPVVTERDIEENHRIYVERRNIYKEKGFDFAVGREFILRKAGELSGSILEVGTGSGDMTVTLAKAGYKITAVDKDAESLKKSALNLVYENLLSKVVFYEMDAEKLDFPDKSFNNIVCVNSFHHIKSVDRVLSEMSRVLCKNGKLLLADFNEKGMAVVGEVHKNEGRVHEDIGPGRAHIYSFLAKNGYKIESYEEQYHWVLICSKNPE